VYKRVNLTLEQNTNAQRGIRGIAVLFLELWHYMGVGGQRHAPAALAPSKTRYELYRRPGGPYGWSEMVRKISPPPGLDLRTVQPIVGALYRGTPTHKKVHNLHYM